MTIYSEIRNQILYHMEYWILLLVHQIHLWLIIRIPLILRIHSPIIIWYCVTLCNCVIILFWYFLTLFCTTLMLSFLIVSLLLLLNLLLDLLLNLSVCCPVSGSNYFLDWLRPKIGVPWALDSIELRFLIDGLWVLGWLGFSSRDWILSQSHTFSLRGWMDKGVRFSYLDACWCSIEITWFR